ncbi:hypothetical protein AB0F17_33065 [Nonomuraea sp. NPDC026600]|uniref:hypothetical protein n=1 Tax=Nonomuraea sp. NPDC026600 TaxID=3155363 RepID=UPI0033DD1946
MTPPTILVTGLAPDDLAETRAANNRLEDLLDRQIPLHVQNDPPAACSFQRSGGGGFPAAPTLPDGS